MVRPVEVAPAGCHRKKGEKANKKQMACIGCVYTIDPHVRTAEELVATLFRDPDRPRRKSPEARQKRYWTSLTREEGGRTVRAQDEVFQHLRDDVALRRRPRQTVVHRALPVSVQNLWRRGGDSWTVGGDQRTAV